MSESNRHRRVAAEMARRYGVDPEIFARLVAKESGWDPDARGSAGEIGYTQPLLETALNPGYGVTPLQDRSDPIDNLRFGAEYLGALLREYGGDYRKALMAYNGGSGNVDRGTVSDEAKRYASDLLGGKELKSSSTVDESIVPQVEDRRGMAAIQKGILEFLTPKSLPLRSAPGLKRTGRSGRMSPLSGVGIPGLGDIERYSTPGGIESLYRKR